MGVNAVEAAASVFSNLFRLATYIFLRVIPATHMKWVLPTLFAGYASCLLLAPPATNTSQIKVEVKTEEKQNGVQPDGANADSVVAIVHPTAATTISSLLFSLPSSLKRTRLLNLAINVLLLNFVLDLYLTPLLDPSPSVTFSRVGAVGPDSAKIAVRYPFSNATEGIVHVVYRQVLAGELLSMEAGAWKDGPIASVSEDSDWTAVVKLSGLWPSTSYEYRLADSEKYLLPTPAQPVRFKTFPDPRLPSGNRFRFIVSSCQTPNFPYRPLASRRIKGYDLLAEYLWPTPPKESPISEEVLIMEELLHDVPDAQVKETTENVEPITAVTSSEATLTTGEAETETNTVPFPSAAVDGSIPELVVTQELEAPAPAEFMLFLGDFVYADVPVWWGDSKEAYRRLYRRIYNSPSFRKVYEKLPMFNVYDDHEIINNFAGLGNDSHPYANASDAWTLYNGAANPDATETGQHYFDFRYGDVAFFVMDTRRFRSDVFTTEVEERTMLGENQAAALYEWLGKVNQTTTFKFIVTSVPFTSLWTHDAQIDSWAGFTKEKNAILEALHSVPNVVLLSGDRHEAAVIEFAPPASSGHKLFEISTSPLSMFYIPVVRTLDNVSMETVERVQTITSLDVDGNQTVTEVVEEVPKERVLNYTPIGNYKWSAIEVDTRDLDRPLAKLELVADGRVAYKLEIVGTPVKLKTTTALGNLVPHRFSQFFSRMGFDPSRWF